MPSHGGAASLIRHRPGDLDLFPLPDGRMLHPYELVGFIREDLASWVAQYQLVQQARDHVVLRVVPGAAPPAGRLDRIADAARALLGPRVQFDLVVTRTLPRELSGAPYAIRSHVAGTLRPDTGGTESSRKAVA